MIRLSPNSRTFRSSSSWSRWSRVFFRGPRASFFFTVFLTLVLAGCTRETPGPDRLAVIPFENLSSDPQLDADGRGAGGAIVYDLAGAPKLYAETVQSRNGAFDMHATR